MRFPLQGFGVRFGVRFQIRLRFSVGVSVRVRVTAIGWRRRLTLTLTIIGYQEALLPPRIG